MSDEYERLRGKRCVALVRCSTLKQANTSIPDQIRAIEAFADKHGLIVIDTIILEGVSGSRPGNRQDIPQIIQRKQERNDFEVLLVHDTTRLTRGGMKHGSKIEWELEAEGIEIVYVMEQMPSGLAGDVLRSMKFYTANEQARGIAMNVARGQMSAIEKGQAPHSKRQIYGIDVMYVGHDGKPRYVIRTLPDGTQLKLDPSTGAITQRFGANPKTGKPARYKKLEDESAAYVPGEPQRVEAVRQMYRSFLIDRRGFARITQDLNRAKILSPTGKPWHKKSVKNILSNTIYTGIGVANRQTNAVYFVRSPGAPVPSDVTREELAKRKRPKMRLRGEDAWRDVPQSALADFLPPDVREKAIAYQQKYWSDRAAGKFQPGCKSNPNATDILNGLLISAPGGLRMFARKSGPEKYRRGYYRVSRAASHPGSLPSVFQKGVPSAPLNQLSLLILQLMLNRMPDLKPRLRRLIKAEFASTSHGDADISVLTARKAKLQQQREFVMENVDVVGKDEARQRLARLNGEVGQIETEIAQLRDREPWNHDRVERTVEALVALLSEMPRRLRDMPIPAVRRVFEVLLMKAEVELESRTATFELALPRWAVEQPKLLEEALFLGVTSGRKSNPKEQTISLMKFRVFWLGDMYFGYGVAA